MHPGLKSEKAGDVQKLYRNCCCGRDVQEVRIHKEEAIRLNTIILNDMMYISLFSVCVGGGGDCELTVWVRSKTLRKGEFKRQTGMYVYFNTCMDSLWEGNTVTY